MPKLPRIAGKEAVQVMEKLGLVQTRQRGSHVVLKKKTASGDIGCVIPPHKELAIGTLQGILKRAKVSVDDFLANV